MRPFIKKLFPLFAFASVSFLYDGAQAQSNKPVIYTNPDNKEAVRNKAFEQALIKVYYDNPMIYDFHRRALNGSSEASRVKSDMSVNDKSAFIYRMLPSVLPQVGSVLGDYFSRDWQTNKDVFNRRLREEMASSPEAVAQIASQIRTEMYRSGRSSQSVKEIYNLTKTIEDDDHLPNAVSLEGLRQQYPDIVNGLEVPGFDEKDAAQLAKGEMTKKDFSERKKLDKDSGYIHYVIDTYLKKALDAQKLPPKALNERQKEELLKKLQEDVQSYSDHLYAGTSFLALLDKDAARKLSTAGNASIQIYESIGKMKINNAFNARDLGNIASGLGMIFGLFGGPDPTVQALNSILENQAKMMTQLNEIDAKVEKIQSTLDYFMQISTYRHEQIMSQFNIIKNKLGDIEVSLSQERQFNVELAQYTDIQSFMREKNILIREFNDDRTIRQWYDSKALGKNYAPNTVVANFLSNTKTTLRKIGLFATQELENPQNMMYNDQSTLNTLKMPDLAVKEGTDINKLMALLPSIGLWLHNQSKEEKHAEYPAHAENQVNGLNLNRHIPNPAIFSQMLQEYIRLALYRPVEYDRDGTVIQDSFIPDFCADINAIDQAIAAMRETAPLAIAVFNYHLNELKQRHDQFILDRAKQETIYQEQPGKSLRIIFSGLSEDEMTDALMKMSEDEFAAFGEMTGTLRKEMQSKTDEETVFYHVGGRGNGSDGDRSYVKKKTTTTTTSLIFTPRVPETKISGSYINKIHVDYYEGGTSKKEPHYTRSEDPAVNRTKREPFARTIAQEIGRRHKNIAHAWAQTLTDHSDYYLLDLYKAQFAVKTLVKGGYGLDYGYAPALSEISKTIDKADSLLRAVSLKWKDDLDVFYPDSAAIQAYGLQPHDNKTLSLYTAYLANHADIKKANDSSATFISIVPSYKIPPTIKDPAIIEIGNLQAAKDALKWASHYPDMKPPAGFLPQPK